MITSLVSHPPRSTRQRQAARTRRDARRPTCQRNPHPGTSRTRGPQNLARRWESRDGGAVSVELVIATPLLITMLLVVVQYALWAHASHIAATAARRGADAARVYGATPTAGSDAAQITLDQLGDAVLTATHIRLDARPERITITVTGTAVSLLPGVSLPVTGHATGTVERFTP